MNPANHTSTRTGRIAAAVPVFVAFISLSLISPVAAAQPESGFEREKRMPLNILKDQAAIWISPAHLKFKPMLFVVPMGIASATSAHYDGDIMRALGRDTHRERISGYVGHAGTLPVNFGFAGATYAIGKVSGNSYLAETGLLTLEALTDTSIITGIAKLAGDRRRAIDGGDGAFRTDGSSFFSGHASLTWTTATVLATRYSHKPWVKYPAYLMAAGISASRVTARKHYVSDVLVGTTVGFLIGKYVANRNGEGFLSRVNFTPISDRRTDTLGVRVSLR